MARNSLSFVEQSLNGWLQPKTFAESWDNVGLLIGSGRFSKDEKKISTILCCNDLTSKVVKEAIGVKADMIIAYHPPIFSALKTVSYGSWKEEIVAKCIGHDIVVYSPHTTLDAVIGGINDRIIDSLRTLLPQSESTVDAVTPAFLDKSTPGISFESSAENISKLYASIPFHNLHDVTISFNVQELISGNGNNVTSLQVYFSQNADAGRVGEIKAAAESLNIPEFKNPNEAPAATLGSGRVLTFKKPVNITNVVENLKKTTGIKNIKLAQGPKQEVTSLALCVGSGASLLKGLPVDVLITGEMQHHDVLDSLEAQQSVILCGHADSERHYLPTLAAIVSIITQCPNVLVSEADQPLFKFV